jgi:glycine oxidase
VLQEAAEAAQWAVREATEEIRRHTTALPSRWPASLLPAAYGAFAMKTARLDVPTFLTATREFFTARLCYRQTVVPVAEIQPRAGSAIRLPLPDQPTADYVAFCQGYTTAPHPSFAWVPFKAARGDILTLHQPQHGLQGLDIHGKCWIAPQDQDHILLGATYDWADPTPTPSWAGQQELLGKLARLLRHPGQVVRHVAAVRPIIRESRGLLGRHPGHPQLLYFNGLGSKGSLHGPQLAHWLADHLIAGTPLPREHDLQENA